LTLLGYPLPKNLAQFAFKMPGQLIRLLAHYLKLGVKTNLQNYTIIELVNADEQAAYLAYFANDPKTTIYSSLRGLNTAQKLGPSPELARAHSTWSLICGFASLHGRAEYHLQQAETMSRQMVSQQMGNVEIKITILTREAVYYSSTGQWSKADAALAEGITLAEGHNIWRARQELYLTSGWSLFRRGKFSQSLEQYKTGYHLSKKQYNFSFQGMSLNGIGGNYLRMGRIKSAIDSLCQTDALIPRVPANNLYVSINKGWLIEAHLYNNEPEPAILNLTNLYQMRGQVQAV
jgi:tetratricopeptide (TPR) repeat protein